MSGERTPSTRVPSPASRSDADQRPLRIGFSGLFLGEPRNGTGRYARRVLEQFALAADTETIIFGDQSADRLYAPDGLAPPRLRVVQAPKGPKQLPLPLAKVVWEQLGLPFATSRTRIDVLYSPHFSVPLLSRRPTVVSIHDVIPLTEPAYAGSRVWDAYFKLVGSAARRATAVVTLSHFAAAEIELVLKIPRSRIHVVYPGTEPSFRPPRSGAVPEVLRRLALPERYMLYVGGAVAHKNIGVLFHALHALKARMGTAVADVVPPLLVAAPVPHPAPSVSYPDWRGLAAQVGVSEMVQFIERIPEADLAAVYAGATAFLFPSRNEGFGLTPLEAMACGTPVLCSNAASLPEAVGDAAHLVPPDDVEAWGSAIITLCTDAHLRQSLRERGFRRAASLRWEDTASQVLEIIREAARCAS